MCFTWREYFFEVFEKKTWILFMWVPIGYMDRKLDHLARFVASMFEEFKV